MYTSTYFSCCCTGYDFQFDAEQEWRVYSCGRPCLVPNLRGKALSLSPLSMEPAVGLQMPFTRLRKFSSISVNNLLRVPTLMALSQDQEILRGKGKHSQFNGSSDSGLTQSICYHFFFRDLKQLLNVSCPYFIVKFSERQGKHVLTPPYSDSVLLLSHFDVK